MPLMQIAGKTQGMARCLAVERETPLEASELHLLNTYRRAANYLSIGQIYLPGNLLREPLTEAHAPTTGGAADTESDN